MKSELFRIICHFTFYDSQLFNLSDQSDISVHEETKLLSKLKTRTRITKKRQRRRGKSHERNVQPRAVHRLQSRPGSSWGDISKLPNVKKIRTEMKRKFWSFRASSVSMFLHAKKTFGSHSTYMFQTISSCIINLCLIIIEKSFDTFITRQIYKPQRKNVKVCEMK